MFRNFSCSVVYVCTRRNQRKTAWDQQHLCSSSSTGSSHNGQAGLESLKLGPRFLSTKVRPHTHLEEAHALSRSFGMMSWLEVTYLRQPCHFLVVLQDMCVMHLLCKAAIWQDRSCCTQQTRDSCRDTLSSLRFPLRPVVDLETDVRLLYSSTFVSSKCLPQLLAACASQKTKHQSMYLRLARIIERGKVCPLFQHTTR
jgi:hypothetical protein